MTRGGIWYFFEATIYRRHCNSLAEANGRDMTGRPCAVLHANEGGELDLIRLAWVMVYSVVQSSLHQQLPCRWQDHSKRVLSLR